MKKIFLWILPVAVVAICLFVIACNDNNKNVSVDDVTLDKNEITLELVNDSYRLVATVIPDNATNTGVVWSSDNHNVATVDDDGLVIATGEGKCTITVRTDDGDKTATCNVSVPKQPPVEIPVADIALDETDLTLKKDDTWQLTATVTPENASDKSVTWTSSDTQVATVNKNGLIVAKGYGECFITVTTVSGGKTATCKVAVPSKVTSVSVNKSQIIIIPGKTSKLTATVYPGTATNKNLIWSSNLPQIATVDKDGVVKGVAKGTAVIEVKTEDGGFTKTCEVTVLDPDKYIVTTWPEESDYWYRFNYSGITGIAAGKQSIVNPNVWLKNRNYKQTMYIANPGDWIIEANANTGWGGVQCYPGSGWEMDYPEIPIKNIKSMVSSWEVEFPQDASKVAAWACYDNWYNNWAVEVMITVATTAPNNYNGKTDATATFNGQIWHMQEYTKGKFYVWKRGEDHQHVVNMLKGEVDLQQFVVWMEDNGYLKAGSTWTMGGFGYEICDTRGVDQIFRLNDFKVHIER